MRSILLVAVLGWTCACSAQQIPPGTILPVQLNTTLRSDTTRPGTLVKARIMQDVPLQLHSKIHAGAVVTGHVTNVVRGGRGEPAEISVRFDSLKEGKRTKTLTTDLRALASPLDVDQAQIPDAGPDRGTSEYDWVTEQIGGETVYHGSVVTNGSQVVGHYVHDGVLVNVSANPESRCRGPVEGNDRAQALWLFASNACGVYDVRNVRIQHAGRTNPVGEIRLVADHGAVKILAGSGMLLRVR